MEGRFPETKKPPWQQGGFVGGRSWRVQQHEFIMHEHYEL
jgi:hypothetical protein